MSFYGLNGKVNTKKLTKAVSSMQEIYPTHYTSDMLLTFRRNMSFFKDDSFRNAFLKNSFTQMEQAKAWRAHTLCWAAAQSLLVEGEGHFVECGTHLGHLMNTVLDFLSWNEVAGEDRHEFFLYDTWDGIPPLYSTERERLPNSEYRNPPDQFERVTQRFQPYHFVHLVRGILPDVFDSEKGGPGFPSRISFLHLDMNCTEGEVLTLEVLFPYVLPGGIIILDDYGHDIFAEQQMAHQGLARMNGHEILELPTGQGLIVKSGNAKDRTLTNKKELQRVQLTPPPLPDEGETGEGENPQ